MKHLAITVALIALGTTPVAHAQFVGNLDNNTLAGGLVGAGLGGVIGSNLAPNGLGDEYTAIGATVGGLAGAAYGNRNSRYAGNPYAGQFNPGFNSRTLLGTGAGAVIGGAIGSNLAGRGVRQEGTALGAVLGGAAGYALANRGRSQFETYGPGFTGASGSSRYGSAVPSYGSGYSFGPTGGSYSQAYQNYSGGYSGAQYGGGPYTGHSAQPGPTLLGYQISGYEGVSYIPSGQYATELYAASTQSFTPPAERQTVVVVQGPTEIKYVEKEVIRYVDRPVQTPRPVVTCQTPTPPSSPCGQGYARPIAPMPHSMMPHTQSYAPPLMQGTAHLTSSDYGSVLNGFPHSQTPSFEDAYFGHRQDSPSPYCTQKTNCSH